MTEAVQPHAQHLHVCVQRPDMYGIDHHLLALACPALSLSEQIMGNLKAETRSRPGPSSSQNIPLKAQVLEKMTSMKKFY